MNKPLTNKCSSCGGILSAGVKFCGKCGAKVVSVNKVNTTNEIKSKTFDNKVPVQENKKEENTNDNEENYAWSDTRELSNHTLNIGLGVKLPTGEFEEELADKVNPGFQVGTGSWDVYPIVMYGYSNNNLGFTTTIAYYFKSENKNEYKFGNQLSYSTTMYYTLLRNEKAIKPFLGLSGDVFDSIEQFGETLVNTDGSIFNGAVGMEYATGKILLGAKYTQPLYQDLFNGNVKSKSQIALYLNFSI